MFEVDGLFAFDMFEFDVVEFDMVEFEFDMVEFDIVEFEVVEFDMVEFVIVLFAFRFVLAVEAVLVLAASPQAIPRAPRAKRLESAIIFLI